MNLDTVRNSSINQWIIIHLRYLVGFAFLPSGMTKVVGNRFTQISPDTPVGAFFETLYQSGIYWNFLGVAQVIAGILLMTQRYATLGALMFLAILSNIWVITISLSFNGTWIITSLMMIAVIILVIWDRHKWLPVLSYHTPASVKGFPEPGKHWMTAGFVYAVCFISIFLLGTGKGHAYAGIMPAAFVIVILLTFAVSNYKAYLRRKSQVLYDA